MSQKFKEDGAEIRRRLKKALKDCDFEATAYYHQLATTNWVAAVNWEQFKGSWAYEQWIKKPDTCQLVSTLKAKQARFSWW